MTSSNILDYYNENGFCVVRNILAQEKLTHVLSEIDTIFASLLNNNGLKVVSFKDDKSVYENMKALFNYDVTLYLEAARHCSKLASLQNLTSNEEVVNLASEFGIRCPSIPSAPVLHISSDELQIPGGYYGVAPHQDWTSVQGGLGSIVMWIPFMDIDLNRFPLEVIPGSHKKGLWSGKIEEHTFTIDENLYSEDDFVRNEVNLGDAIIMSVFTVHRTGLKDCKGLRIASSTRYESADEQTFIDRGYPCAYKRSVEREFITPDFPTVEQVQAMFDKKSAG